MRGGEKILVEVDGKLSAGLKGRQFRSEGNAKLPGGNGATVGEITDAAPPMNEVSGNEPARDNDGSGDEWYWYVVLPASTWLLWLAGGILGTGGWSRSGHEKPNV